MMVSQPEAIYRTVFAKPLTTVSEGGTHKSRSSIDGHTMSDVELGKLGEVCGHVGYRVSLPDWTRRTSAYWRYVDSEEVYVTNRMIHGLRRVPQGYRLAFVPRDALVSFNGDDTTCQGPNGSLFQRLVSGIAVLPLKFWKFVWHGICNVCSKLTLGSLTSSSDNVRIATGEVTHSYSLPKAIISLLQTLYASVTLYRTRADQLDRFGYASFSLTVAPYAIMSAVNLLANVVTPDYSAMYLVNSSVLREARNRDEKAFDGVVGKLIEDDSRKPAIRGLCEVVIVAKVESQGEDEASSSRYNDPISSGSSGDTNTRTLVASQSSNALRVIIKSEQTEDANLDPPETEPEQAAEQPTTPASERYKFIPEAELSPDSGPEWYLDIPACPWFLRESDNSTARALVEKWQPSHKFVRRFGGLIHAVVVVAIASLSLIIIGRISHFKPGGSSFIQRFFTMAWFSCGVVMGLSFGIFPSSRAGALRQASRLGLVFYGMLDAAPFAIYAFITRIPAKIKDPNLKFWDNSIHWHRYLRETYSWDFVDRLGTDRHPRDGDDTFSYRMRKFELFQVRLAFVTSLLFFLAPPIAGFVLVGLMIREEGTCLIV